MKQEDSREEKPDFDIKEERRRARERRKKLHDYFTGYTVEKFMDDLCAYFDGEIDFNLEKIREAVSAKGKLIELIRKAEQKDTHPVSEFLQELFLI
jgi:hypothetical protein